jgi:hypothetical protein
VLQYVAEDLRQELDPQGLLAREQRQKRRRILAINRRSKQQVGGTDAECIVLSESDDDPAKDIRVERKVVLQKVLEQGIDALEKASLELRDNKDFMLAAMASCSPFEALRHASLRLQKELYADSAFVLRVVEEVGGSALGNASKRLRSNPSFMMSAADSCSTSEVLEYASEELRAELNADSEFVLRHLSETGPAALGEASESLRADQEFMAMCAKFCSLEDVLPYASAELRHRLAPERRTEIESSVPTARPSKAPRLQSAVAVTGDSLPAEKPEIRSCDASPDIKSNVDGCSGDVSLVVRPAVEELRAPVVETPSEERVSSITADREVSHQDAPSSGTSGLDAATHELHVKLCSDRDSVLRLVKQDGPSVLAKTSLGLRENPDFLLAAAVAGAGAEAFSYATDSLKKSVSADRDFLLRAVKDIGSSMLAYASKELCADLGFMLAVITSCPVQEALQYASEDLRTNLLSED